MGGGMQTSSGPTAAFLLGARIARVSITGVFRTIIQPVSQPHTPPTSLLPSSSSLTPQ